jgi:hypothetical protein
MGDDLQEDLDAIAYKYGVTANWDNFSEDDDESEGQTFDGLGN